MNIFSLHIFLQQMEMQGLVFTYLRLQDGQSSVVWTSQTLEALALTRVHSIRRALLTASSSSTTCRATRQKPGLSAPSVESFKFSTSLSNHRRTSCRRASLYSCTICEGFQSLRGKLAHQCLRETPVRLQDKCFECWWSWRNWISRNYCRIKDLANSFELSDITENHHGTKDQSLPIQCSQCHLRFSERAELNAHFISHGGEQTSDCRKCGVSFSDLPRLVDHVDKEHRRRSKTKLLKKTDKPGTQQESD